MPAKVVYGKRRIGQRAAFTKFLSAEKEVAHEDVESRNADNSALGDWRQQLLEAAATAGEDTAQPLDHVSVLEKGLGDLQIERRQTEKEESITKKRTKAKKQGKASRHADVDVPKENVVPLEDVLEQGMQSLKIDSVERTDQKTLQKPKKSRKALSDRDSSAPSITGCPVADLPRQKKEKKRARPTSVTQLPTPEPTPEPDDLYSIYASALLALSDRKKIIAFQDWADELAPHFEVSKIAEASFSEVYRLSSTSASGLKQESVLKVVALKTPPTVPLPCQVHGRAVRDLEAQIEKETAQRDEQDQWKSHVEDVLSEIKLLQNVTHIPGFTVFRDLTVVQGRPSTSFNDAWKEWNKSRPRGKKSEFPDPSKKTSYDETQLWAVIEMQDAGTDCEKIMESGGIASIWEAWDVFWGVAISVGKAEEACRFEHRDLHLGNICVRSSRKGGDVLQPCVKDPLRRKLRFTGLETTVIDYTLSRADIVAPGPLPRRLSSLSHVSSSTAGSTHADDDNNGEADVAYLDLDKDPAIFEGDASEEYQYEIYRYMRGAAIQGNPMSFEPPANRHDLQEPDSEAAAPTPPLNTHIRFDDDDDNQTPCTTSSPWRSFHPKTNLIWLHFLLHKLLAHLSSVSAPAPHNTLPLSRFLLKSNPVAVDDDNDNDADVQAQINKKAAKLFKVLKRVSELLCPVALGRDESLESVKELVVLALEERWVRVGDVAG